MTEDLLRVASADYPGGNVFFALYRCDDGYLIERSTTRDVWPPLFLGDYEGSRLLLYVRWLEGAGEPLDMEMLVRAERLQRLRRRLDRGGMAA